MGVENVIALLIIGAVLLLVGYLRLRRKRDSDIERELERYESESASTASSKAAAKDPFQAAADQSNYRNYR